LHTHAHIQITRSISFRVPSTPILRASTRVPILTHTQTHTHARIYIYIYEFFSISDRRRGGYRAVAAVDFDDLWKTRQLWRVGTNGKCLSAVATTAAADGYPEPPGDVTVGVRAGHTKQLYLHLSDVAGLAAVVFPLWHIRELHFSPAKLMCAQHFLHTRSLRRHCSHWTYISTFAAPRHPHPFCGRSLPVPNARAVWPHHTHTYTHTHIYICTSFYIRISYYYIRRLVAATDRLLFFITNKFSPVVHWCSKPLPLPYAVESTRRVWAGSEKSYELSVLTTKTYTFLMFCCEINNRFFTTFLYRCMSTINTYKYDFVIFRD